jgi:hypothetical protein
MLTFTLQLSWRTGRTIRVQVRGVPLLRSGRSLAGGSDDTTALGHDDVASLTAFQEFLERITRLAAEGGTVWVVGFDPDVVTVLELLEITGPPPEPINVEMTPQ